MHISTMALQPHVVPTTLNCSPWFSKKGVVQQQHFQDTPRESLRNHTKDQIPLTSVVYKIFGDIAIPCQSPEFPQHYKACNKIYLALATLAKANATKDPSELVSFYAEAADAFAQLDDFPWEVPENSKFPTLADNKVKIAAALRAVSLYYTPDSLSSIETIDQITALNDEATTEYQMLSAQALTDIRYSLLSIRACAESDRLLKVCQTDCSDDDVKAFVQHAATAVVLREKVEKPSQALVDKTEELVAILQQYHSAAYQDFLATFKEQ